MVERQRRSEQKGLFDKLVNLLNADPKTPRLHLLTMVSAPTFAFKTALTSVVRITEENGVDPNDDPTFRSRTLSSAGLE